MGRLFLVGYVRHHDIVKSAGTADDRVQQPALLTIVGLNGRMMALDIDPILPNLIKFSTQACLDRSVHFPQQNPNPI